MAHQRSPSTPAGGGVVVRNVGNECARHCGASSRDRRTRRPAQPDPAWPPAVVSRCRRPPPTGCAKPRAGSPTGWKNAQDSVALPDLAYTLARRRAHRPVRTAVIAGDLEELVAGIASGRRRRCSRIRPRSGRTTAVRCGCSPGRVRSGRRWAPTCSPTNRCSPPPSRRWSR